MSGPLHAMGLFLATILLLAWPYIDLQVAVPVGAWAFNAPVAHLAALALAPLGLFAASRKPLPPALRT